MRGMMQLAIMGVLGAPGGLRLPLAFDFSTMPDGALPSLLKGTTWSISSGKAINTPTLGPNLLPDPSLEATYTSGLCDTLTKFGSPTVAESADAHEGSKAQQFTATAAFDRLRYPTVNGAANTWYQFSMWGKRTAGANNYVQANLSSSGAIPSFSAQAYNTADYKRVKTSLLRPSAGTLSPFAAYQASGQAFPTAIVDDGALNAIDHASLFALTPATHQDVTIKAQPDTLTDATSFGLVLRATSQYNPDDAILVGMYRQGTDEGWCYIYVINRVAGQYVHVRTTASAIVPDAYLAARVHGNTLHILYNDVQLETDITLTDAALLTGKHHGLWSTGDTAFKTLVITEA